jgi:truncated hemoglobin YjbI
MIESTSNPGWVGGDSSEIIATTAKCAVAHKHEQLQLTEALGNMNVYIENMMHEMLDSQHLPR